MTYSRDVGEFILRLRSISTKDIKSFDEQAMQFGCSYSDNIISNCGYGCIVCQYTKAPKIIILKWICKLLNKRIK